MTPDQFTAAQRALGFRSRAAFAAALGIAPNSAAAYASGRRPVPQTVALAIRALWYRMPEPDFSA